MVCLGEEEEAGDAGTYSRGWQKVDSHLGGTNMDHWTVASSVSPDPIEQLHHVFLPDSGLKNKQPPKKRKTQANS